ncbi:RNA polymerase sigma factor FliA [Thiobacter aerophilum]|uniref:RNA polymerase sigma factor FliA n=1 Tax=Thiobacter aerophilum TaxID=3121275 RepID=A0ABV0EID2_9BURK
MKKEEYVEKFAPLVKRIAYHLMTRLPASVQVDDLIQAGLIGLLDAANHYDGTQGAQFETYAVQRIRGAMLDELRHADWLPRTVRKNLRQIEAAISKLEQSLGRPPTESELAQELNVSLADYQQMLLDARGHQLVYYEDLQDSEGADFLERHHATDADNPLRILEDQGFRQMLVEAIKSLPERERQMMAMYYEQDLNLREIGEVLGVTESRVCQLHTQAVARLRAKLREWLES